MKIQCFGSVVFGCRYMDLSLEELSRQVAELLERQKLTIATAESCTGGWIGKELTAIPGSSTFFSGGIIAYSNEIKQKLLNVPVATLEEYGAVSEQAVLAMAKGAKEALCVDIAVAVSGIAGPTGGSADKPVGTVWLGWALPNGETYAKVERFSGTRDDVRKLTVYRALNEIQKIIAE